MQPNNFFTVNKFEWKKKIAACIFLFWLPFLSCHAEAAACSGPYLGKALTANAIKQIFASQPREKINFCGALLNKTNLSHIDLSNVDLSRADLSEAELQNVDLSYANLFLTYFRWSNLSQANLQHANLQQAILEDAKLQNADLEYADLRNANLANADLSGSKLLFANLEGANLTGANLVNADLTWVILTNADLSGANLANANLENVMLDSANLRQVNLTNADLMNANLKNVIYQPKLGSLPDLIAFLTVKNFHTIRYQDSMSGLAALTELQKSYKDIGVRSMERLIISTIKYQEMMQGFAKGGWNALESSLSYLFFYLPSDYGAAPSRPLKIFLVATLLFFFPYRIALSSANRRAGIFVLWIPKRFFRWNKIHTVSTTPKLLRKVLQAKQEITYPREQWRLCRIALLFSLLSAFRLGWGSINVSNWISRIQAREYMLEGKGWVRVVAGLQSLFSAYLVVLWLVVYFGRPFEW